MIASMAGLFVIGDATFNSLATGSILVVAIAVLGSITVLPALLAKLGRWVDRPAGPAAVAAQPPDRPGRDQQPRAGPGAAAPGVALRGRPVSSSCCSRCPALGMKMHSGQPGDAARRRSPRCRPSSDRAGQFPSEGTTATLVVCTGPPRSGRR